MLFGHECLQDIVKIPAAWVNPNALDHFILRDVELVSGNLIIAGMEYSSEALLQSRRLGSHIYPEDYGEFERVIPLGALH
jgi:hypothetical protein